MLDGRILPWEINGNKQNKLFNVAPPKLQYPAGSRDETTNERFVTEMDMYLKRSYLVRSVINGDTPHPFSVYERLQQYWSAMGSPNKVFNTAETFSTLDKIKSNGHEAFHSELVELLWFGGVVSYGSIMAEVYVIIYKWIDPDDLPEIEGLCEINDGITFRIEVIKSLKIVRVNHKQQIINNLYTKLDNVTLIMRSGGMKGYFAKLRKQKLKLKEQGEKVTDAYLLHRTVMATQSKHPKLDEVIAALRRQAGTSGIPTSFEKMQDVLTDTFDYEVPDAAKTEKPAKVLANYANKRRAEGDNDGPGNRKKKKWERPVFPVGSCTRCPDATDHTTKRCWILFREKKGLPPGFKWCLAHPKGIHYDHKCKRHAPNYPPVPTPPVSGALASFQDISAEQFKDRFLAMLSTAKPVAHTNGIHITKPDGSTMTDFQKTRDVLTNAALNGSPVDYIVNNIISLNSELRAQLQTKLADAGL